MEGVEYQSRGETRLKGMHEEVPVVRVHPVDDPISRLSGSTAVKAMRVAVADDSVLLREGVVRVLKESGFTITAQAGDADELVAAVGFDPPDVVVTDIRMPPTYTDEGLQAAHKIRARHPEVGVLLLSQYVETEFAVELRLGRRAAAGLPAQGPGGQRAGVHRRRTPRRCRRLGDRPRGGRAPSRPRASGEPDRRPDRAGEGSARPDGRGQVEPRDLPGDLPSPPSRSRATSATSFTKLGLMDTPDDHRRVLAVLQYLKGVRRGDAGGWRSQRPPPGG